MNRRELLRSTALVLGTSLTGSLARAVLAGASGDDLVEAASLSTAELGAVAQVSEMIIPTTDTPGAITAGVPGFIHVIHARWYSPEERGRFDVGLRALESLAITQYGKGFSQCLPEQQNALLAEAESRTADPESMLGLFFTSIKALTVFGYYTSEVGSKQELIFNPVPMRYKGDYLFAEVGRQWTP